MKVVGLCGGSGSGKSLVCSFFNDFGVKCIDTDMIYHEIISVNSECTNELISYFGDSISASPGIDRAKLRDIAFRSDDNLKILNAITHKHILNEVRLRITEIKTEGTAIGIIIDAPLLFESGFDEECELTVAVISDTDKRIERIIERDGISYDQAVSRVSRQISNDTLIKICDYVIENNSTPDALKSQVCELTSTLFDD